MTGRRLREHQGLYTQGIRQGEISVITAAMRLPTSSLKGILYGSELAILYSRNPLAAKPTVIKIEKDEEEEKEVEYQPVLNTLLFKLNFDTLIFITIT